MKLLCLSNGHGEDAIAIRILAELQKYPQVEKLAAMPIVGQGWAYQQASIPLLGPAEVMPSGGFIYMDGRQLVRDLRGGLLGLSRRQLQVAQTWAREGGQILAVGDIVPLLFAWWSGATYAFVGTAKSDYYLPEHQRGRKSDYFPWERWLMSRPRCQAVFPRDRLTTETLRQWSIPAFDVGNPMMDGLCPHEHPSFADPNQLTFVLLPGSRPPEAYANWQLITTAIAPLLTQVDQVLFLGAIAPGLDLNLMRQILLDQGWQVADLTELSSLPHKLPPTLLKDAEALCFSQSHSWLILTQTAFADCLHQADVAIAMTGTGAEQFAGLGKPVISLPGTGPQFTPAFARKQVQLLGCSVTLVEQPQEVAQTVMELVRDGDRLEQIARNGQLRMGTAGAAQRIAHHLINQ
jgi:uncharacterized protein (TIGR03492 family)